MKPNGEWVRRDLKLFIESGGTLTGRFTRPEVVSLRNWVNDPDLQPDAKTTRIVALGLRAARRQRHLPSLRE